MNIIILHVAYTVYNYTWWYKIGLVPILNGLGIQINAIL